MTRPVLTAVGESWESDLVAAVEGTEGYAVSRRCADLADLLASGAAGLGELALVSPDLRALDRAALHQLTQHSVHVAGVVAPGDEMGERRLRQLGLEVVVAADVVSPDLEDALDQLVAGAGSGLSVQAEPEPQEEPAAAPGRVIAVWGPTGAPGRSTVALNLAAELAAGAPTLLVDADTYGSTLAQALGLLDEAPGMAAACRAADQGTLDLPTLARFAPEVTPGLRILTGIPRAHRWTELRAASVAHVLDLSRRLATHVVVDCGFSIEDDEELSYDTLAPRRNASTLTALEASDELVVVGSGDPIGLQRLVRAVQDLSAVPSPSARVVVNKVRASAVGARPERRIAEALSRFAGMDDLAFLPWDQASLDTAMFAGVALRESAPQSELRRAFVALAQRYAAAEPARRERTRRRG